MIDPNNPYSAMQRAQYDKHAEAWNLNDKDHVIGNFQAHLEYDDFEDLFGLEASRKVRVLDFGCGPGRNLVRFGKYFQRIDGVDISPICLEKAKVYLEAEGYDPKDFTLYETNGVDLQNVPSELYDIVMSVITLQHICVHEIRYNLMKEFHRVLKAGGMLTAQMGFGKREGGHDYYENFYDADGTNGWHDVMVENTALLEHDLRQIGFQEFSAHLTPCRGGDAHDNWIYFKAWK